LSLRDTPLSFDPRHRRYGMRGITSDTVDAVSAVPANRPTDHDPTSVLGTV
jgi:CRISPR system Cascade subunit CasD